MSEGRYIREFSYKQASIFRVTFRIACQAWFSYAADAPAIWPPVLPEILFRYENRSGRQHWSSQSLPPACLRS